MKFVELKKSLVGELKNAYVLYGSDNFLLNYAYGLIKNACNLKFEELNLVVFNDEIINFTNVVNALNTMPMFCDHKLVYVNMEFKNNPTQNINDLVDYFNNINKTSVLVINAGENSQELSKINKFAEFVDCGKLNEKIIAGFVNNDLKQFNKTINMDALQTLILYCVSDLTNINSEIKKLVSYVGDRSVIEKSDVELIVNKTLEFQVYEITDALSKKNAEKVYALISEMKNKKDGIKGILPLIFNYFRRLMHISLNKNLTNVELAKLLNIKEFAVQMSLTQVRNFTKKQLKSICDLCSELDYKIKIGDVGYDYAIEYLILFILNN